MRDSQDSPAASGSARTRSASLDTDCQSASSDSKKKDPKTFSMTIFVNESEKNKIVDLLHKAKSIISKKVEKVMGIKQKSGNISNADALQTVLETWMTREQEEEKEDNIMVEKLIKEQERQVESLIQSGNFKTVPTLEVQEDDEVEEDDDTIEEELDNDLEVSRLTVPRYLKPPVRKRIRSISETSPCSPSARSLSPLENVPCPFLRPESELYPPRLRRPSSLYGAGAAAASSRPPSRQVSVSPSVQDVEAQVQEKLQITSSEPEGKESNIEEEEEEEAEEEEEEEEEEEDYNEIPSYARPDSFIIPIGGVWRPGEEGEVRWGSVTTEQEYQQQLRNEEEGED